MADFAEDGPATPTGRSTPTPSALNDTIDDFFFRNGFDAKTRNLCDEYARSAFPTVPRSAAIKQGYCSYTLNVGDRDIVQFRPVSHGLNEGIYTDARHVLGALVPRTRSLGAIQGFPRRSHDETQPRLLHIYLLDRVQGVTLAELEEERHPASTRLLAVKKRLIKDMGIVFARSFRHGQTRDSQPSGKVGKSLRWRLNLLQDLPGYGLKRVVSRVQDSVAAIEESRWCLTHGDLVPANIIVDPASGQLNGLIDWAEGEYLPFGVGLYGLEELLGVTDAETGLFAYHPNHQDLREEFWRSFGSALRLDGGGCDEIERQEILVARELGILLWRGIAFEDGRIDRVVELGKDDSELHKLRLFLGVPEPIPLARRQGFWDRLRHVLSVFGFWRLCMTVKMHWGSLLQSCSRQPHEPFAGSGIPKHRGSRVEPRVESLQDET